MRTPTLTRTDDGRWRVAADVDGTEVYVTADDPLVANGDAWATMMLLPAAKGRATLRVESDLDSGLHGNFERIQMIARAYWGFEGATVVAGRQVERAPTGGHAMFFTGGVDSFYTLKKRRDSIGRLICVHGFDIDLDDVERFTTARSWIRQIADGVGLPAVFPETNLRHHPAFSALPWSATHVAALAAVAHTLAPVVSRVYVASSDTPAPWGSRPGLDALWSSNAVEIVNDGSEARKLGKVRSIADWPLVHRFLRVCFRNSTSALNCGTCDKCVRTQLLFEIHGTRDRLQTFPQAPLVELIDGIPSIERIDIPLWTELIEHLRSPAIVGAISRLIERRPSAAERLQRETLWLRRTAAGRLVRRVGKRILVR